MPIYTIAQYQVKPSGTEKVKRAIEEFVHFLIFEDEAAHNLHSKSAAVKRFESIYRPELVGKDVVFTDYDLVATNQESTPIQRKAG